MKYLVLLICLLAFFSEAHPQKSTKEDFEVFYNKFYSDTSFHMERIEFPLPGINYELNHPNITEKIETNYYWSQNEYQFHGTLKGDSLVLQNTIYRKRFIKNDNTISEQIYGEATEYFIEKRFQLKDNKWHMVFFDFRPAMFP